MHRELEDGRIPAAEWMTAMTPLLAGGHRLKICPSGTSMVPFIRGGRDEVILCSAAGKELRRGDIVLYRREDGVHVLHRIHHVERGACYMLGDFHTWIEGPVERENILAVASSFIRKGREIQCDGLCYRLLSETWLLTRPFRPLVFRIRGILPG